MNGLSLADNQILGLLFIENYWLAHQSAPSNEDMATECNMTIKQAREVRRILVRKGMVISESTTYQSMRLSPYGFAVTRQLHADEIRTAEDIIVARERLAMTL